MKQKVLVLFCSIVFTFSLVACGANTIQASTTPDANTTADTSSATSLSQVNKLLVGTLKLKDSEQAVIAEQAAKLLPLWRAYRSLSTSQTSAEAEVKALLTQIESTMTADQIKAIDALNLNSTDMMDLMQSMGVARMARGTPDPQSTPGFDMSTGGFGNGAPPVFEFRSGDGAPPSGSFGRGQNGGGSSSNFGSGSGAVIGGGPMLGSSGEGVLGGDPMMQGTPDPSMQATAQARFSTQANQANALLLDVLINELEAKAEQ
jgi:hypothetical protein